MATFNYIDVPNTNLICCICHMPFLNPVTIAVCSHTFCQECILKSAETSSLCPIDRMEFNVEQLKPANPIIRSLVDELLVECTNKPLGCAQICQRQLLSIHLKNSCPYGSVSCPNEDCHETVLRKDAARRLCTHMFKTCSRCGTQVRSAEIDEHQSACSGSMITCEFCKTELQYSMESTHFAICPEVAISCTQASYGCPWKGRRRELTAHVTSCGYNNISGFFALYDTRAAAIADENQILKCRLEAVENVVRVYETNMQAIKVALGPWFHNSHNVSPTATNHHTFPELPPALQTSTPSSHYVHSPSDSLMPTASFGEHQDILAPFFPTEGAMTSQAASRHPQSPNIGPSNSSTFVPSWDPTGIASGYRNSFQNTVAPLDLSSTLEGTLESLRQSIVTLSTSMESLGRRNEIALTNETLRINEEIMSIKANMHGLRMQIHAILMDRNAQVRRVQDSQEGWASQTRLPFITGLVQSPASVTKL